ncbi:DUF4038 domain-containing protein [Dyadobacter sp. CY326]|uniref:apiosidase-like domain-containing protein n=1 Tax=Dyadobacter sp. CY326 TaxID=2907300 RepID=UPI001F29C60E|nr:DUF4038 domain-containing protein [Dyadobacter sp. CY326]MCE7066775.1 glycoside hydrolase family 140 protein [Dyadobacter sp. CY326]
MKWFRYFIFSVLAATCLAAINIPQPSQIAVPKFPLKISPNGRHITDNNGVPFLMVADVAWQMLRKLSHNEAVQYMDIRKAQSFNTFLVQLLPALPNQRNFNKALPFLDNDLSKPNKVYFDYFEKIIAAAKERDLVVGMVVSRKSWNALFDAQDPAVWKNYGAFVGKQFAKYDNIIWIVSEEEYQTAAQFEAIADGIRSASGGQILASLSTCSPTSVNDSSAVRSDLKFIIPDSTVTPAEYAALANWQKNSAEAALRPFLIANSEFPKEITDQSVLIRNQAYQSIMSAAAGFCHMSTIKNFNPTWKVNINKDGAEYIHELVKILKGIPWEYMQPENVPELLPDSADKAEIGIVSLSNKRMSMLYLPESRPVKLNLNYLNGTTFAAVWYSPRTGKRWPGGEFKAAPEAVVQPPDSQPGWDWILLIGAKK